MTKPLLAILLLLQLVAQTHGKEGLEGNSSESPDVMQKQYCLIAAEIEAKLRLERRFKSMGNSGAAGRIGDERRSLSEKEKALLQRIKKEHPQISVPKFKDNTGPIGISLLGWQYSDEILLENITNL